jgi:hypothetical protein
MTAKKIYRFGVVPMFIVLAFCGGVALGADGDLQQYNGTASFAADWTAQAKLLVRDGKKITADDNGAGKAPVNRGLKQVIDIVGGIHDGIFGSAPGATRRTVKSLEADGTGGNVSTLLAGGIASSTANDRSLMTPTDVAVFKISPTGGETKMTKGAIAFTNTADGGGNPAVTAAVANKVIPLNTVKSWGRVFTNAMGALTVLDGLNIASCSASAPNYITCNLAVTMDSTSYLIMVSRVLPGYDVLCDPVTTSQFRCEFYDPSSMPIDCSAAACSLRFMIMGRQTT